MKRIYDIMVVAAVVVATFFYLPLEGSQRKKEVRREAKRYREFLKLLDDYHINMLNYHDITDRAICGALELCDPYSQYLPKDVSGVVRQEIESVPIDTCYMVDSTTLCVKLSKFSRGAGDMLLSNYREMGSPKSLMLDLRGNRGGLVEEAINSAAHFLEMGDLILTRESRTTLKKQYFAKSDGELKDVELIVVIDRETASASEIVVGALKDLKRALIVGEKSYGKGLILKQYYLSDGSSVLIAIAKYLTPDFHAIQSVYHGKCINYDTGGIIPNVEYVCGDIVEYEDVMHLKRHLRKK